MLGSERGAVKGVAPVVPLSPGRVGDMLAARHRIPEAMESRIQELEIRIAFQDDLLASLNEQVHAAHQQIALLRSELTAMRERVEGMKEGVAGDPAQEPPPPHY
jgi:SlyX protein